jgi:hypothetical protein
MGAIKSNLDLFPDTQAFDQGVSYGRHAERQEMLPLLNDALFDLRTADRVSSPMRGTIARLEAVIADIEQPPTPPVTTTPTDDESVNF